MALCPVPINSNNVEVYYVKQTECEALPENPVFKRISFVSGVPTIERETLQSAEIDGGSEVTGVTLGSYAVSNEQGVELRADVHDDLLAACAQNEWVPGSTLASKTVVIDTGSKTATIAGEDLTADIAVNDRLYMPSLTGGNGEVLLVTDISFSTDTVITFGSARVANPQTGRSGLSDETATTDINVSDKLTIGTNRQPIALLIKYNDLEGPNNHQLVMDAEVVQFSFNPQVNAIITGSFSVIGKTMASAQPLPTGATLEPLLARKPMKGIDGSITHDGQRLAFSDSMTFSLNRNGEASYEIGSKFMSHVDYDLATSEISVTSKFVNFDAQLAFEEEEEVSYNFTASVDGQALGWDWPVALLTGVSRTVDSGSIPQELTLMPYKPPGSISTMVMHRVSKA
ncbi:major tail protein [Vibrio phage 1.240.O._10N.261.52.F8]|nr:major tail protein [Vibrio phage 1.240.O._10N.261.52.F8]